jgi:hypothetical protein
LWTRAAPICERVVAEATAIFFRAIQVSKGRGFQIFKPIIVKGYDKVCFGRLGKEMYTFCFFMLPQKQI